MGLPVLTPRGKPTTGLLWVMIYYGELFPIVNVDY